MDLDVLTRGEVADAAAVVVRDVVQAIHLSDRQDPARDLDALHVARVIELVVEAVAEPHRPELFGCNRATNVPLDAALMTGNSVAQLAITRT